MFYISAIIRGEQTLNRYCLKRWGESPQFSETIAHIGDDVTIEKAYLKSPADENYMDYYILYMPHPKGTTADISLLRKRAYESIETGNARLLTV